MQNFTLRDPQGNIILAAESVTAPVSLESYGVALAEADKAMESAFNEAEKYSNAMAVMSSEGFGEQAKAVAKTVLHKIAEFFAKVAEWFGKLGEALNSLLLNSKFAAVAGPKGKELIKRQGEISKQQNALLKIINKDITSNENSENADELKNVYTGLQSWATKGVVFAKEVFVVCKAYSKGVSIISKLTDKSKLATVEDAAGKAIAVVEKYSTYLIQEHNYKNAIANKDMTISKTGAGKLSDGIAELKQITESANKVLNDLAEEEKKLKATSSNPAPEPTKPAA